MYENMRGASVIVQHVEHLPCNGPPGFNPLYPKCFPEYEVWSNVRGILYLWWIGIGTLNTRNSCSQIPEHHGVWPLNRTETKIM